MDEIGGTVGLAGSPEGELSSTGDLALDERLGHRHLVGDGLISPPLGDRTSRADRVAGDPDDRGREATGGVVADRPGVDLLEQDAEALADAGDREAEHADA